MVPETRQPHRRAQTAIEYLLLVAISASVVLLGFKTILPANQKESEGYFNKVSRVIMGENPVPIDGGWCPPDPNGRCACECPSPAFGGRYCPPDESCSGPTGNENPVAFCGDGNRDAGETCANCPVDLGTECGCIPDPLQCDALEPARCGAPPTVGRDNCGMCRKFAPPCAETCNNGRLDVGEAGLDCGAVCRRGCCGNGVIETTQGETCDDGPANGGGGGCSATCQIIDMCGNGVLNTGEDCDGGDLNGETCVTMGLTGGVLACDADCNFDTSRCTVEFCPNGIREGEEECDGSDLGGETCITLGYSGGALGCSQSCEFYTMRCFQLCGNGALDEGEECDGNNFNNQSCLSLGYQVGTLACTEDCTFDTSDCETGTCPNGVRDGNEQCDGNDLGGETCVTWDSINYTGGTLACTSSCTFDDSGCFNCGNGTCDPSENCSTCPADCDETLSSGPSGQCGGLFNECASDQRTLMINRACTGSHVGGCIADVACSQCGNGTCNATENCSVCERDCNRPEQQIVGNCGQTCPDTITQCAPDEACEQTFYPCTFEATFECVKAPFCSPTPTPTPIPSPTPTSQPQEQGCPTSIQSTLSVCGNVTVPATANGAFATVNCQGGCSGTYTFECRNNHWRHYNGECVVPNTCSAYSWSVTPGCGVMGGQLGMNTPIGESHSISCGTCSGTRTITCRPDLTWQDVDLCAPATQNVRMAITCSITQFGRTSIISQHNTEFEVTKNGSSVSVRITQDPPTQTYNGGQAIIFDGATGCPIGFGSCSVPSGNHTMDFSGSGWFGSGTMYCTPDAGAITITLP